MTRGVCLFVVGSFVLVSLAGCSRGFFSAEREPWRAEAEMACLKSGSVKESAELVRISPISGPGVCGAEFPLKVAAFGEGNGSFSFLNEESRPSGNIGNQPRWPISQSSSASSYSNSIPPRSSGPISLATPAVTLERDDIDLLPEGTLGSQEMARPRLGPSKGNSLASFGPVAMKPAATLACPIVSVLDHWLTDSVQPAAMRWFGARVVEIKQISAYSCRGMNGNSHAHISEHAFGNALDIAGFTLADGRNVSVKDGWKGLPEEQGFLRDVQAAACQQFTTVLAPGSNVYHYDHIHVDLMRRASRRLICQPAAVTGEEVVARASGRHPYASREPSVTGSLGGLKSLVHRHKQNDKVNEEDEFEDD